MKVLLVLLLVLGIFPTNFASAEADVSKPELKSISVDQSEVTAGDRVKVSIKVSDDVEVERLYLTYLMPITEKDFHVEMTYDSTTESYVGEIPISENSESGVYKINHLLIYDTSDNITALSNYENGNQELKGGEYTVTGTKGADVTKPELESISVDQSKVTAGDQVKVSIKVSDDVEVERLYLTYLMPITEKDFHVEMTYDSTTESYVGEIPIEGEF